MDGGTATKETKSKKKWGICMEECCNKTACYNYEGQIRPIYCKSHIHEGMINIKSKKCLHLGCRKRASFNFPDEKSAIRCKDHILEGMMDVRSIKCIYETCIKRASFNLLGEKRPLYCRDHKLDSMIDIRSPKCLKCDKTANFNFLGETKPIYCKEHIMNGMLDIKHRKCLECNKIPVFNVQGEKDGMYCKDHMKDNMVNVVSKRCIYPNCGKIPSHNYEGERCAIFCRLHKYKDMVDVVTKRCLSCKKKPHFNYPTEKRGIYCREHMLDGMVDIISKKCSFLNCDKQPIYNYPTKKNGIYCGEHKLDNMVNIKSSKCSYDGCNIIPHYNYPGESRRLFCITHSNEGMIDIRNRRCKSIGCERTATFGKLFHPKIHCSKHRNLNEFKNNNPKCTFNKCKNKPYYSDDQYPKRCEQHKLDIDKNIVEKPCISCGLKYFLDDNTNLCPSCFEFKARKVDMTPNEERVEILLSNKYSYLNIKKQIKVKEIKILNLFQSNCIDFLTHDKKIPDGCSRYRPDFVIEFDMVTIIIEVDEHQHMSYDPSCELGRMLAIHQDLGGIPVLFIRYNPDSYKDTEGKTVRKSDKQREQFLLDYLKGLRNRCDLIAKDNEMWSPNLGVVYLFYDKFDKLDIKIEELNHEKFYKNNQ